MDVTVMIRGCNHETCDFRNYISYRWHVTNTYARYDILGFRFILKKK